MLTAGNHLGPGPLSGGRCAKKRNSHSFFLVGRLTADLAPFREKTLGRKHDVNDRIVHAYTDFRFPDIPSQEEYVLLGPFSI